MPASNNHRLPPPQFIDTDHDLQKLVKRLRGVPLLAVDTESNSLFAYHEQVCLIQLSALWRMRRLAMPEDYLIDPLAIHDMQPLGELFRHPRTEIVFHAAEFDIRSLKRDFGFRFHRIFDTQLAVRILGWQDSGLSTLLESFFDVQQNKAFQQSDWTKRPLSEDQTHYAQMDTHYLPRLRHVILEALRQENREHEARDSFAELCDVPPAEKMFDPDGFWRLDEAHHLRGQQMAILRELYFWRERCAEQLNIAPYRVAHPNLMVKIVERMPQSLHDLMAFRDLPAEVTQRFGAVLLEALDTGKHMPPPKRPSQPRKPDDVLQRFQALQSWRKHKARERGVESDVILSRTALWALAHHDPASFEALATIQEVGNYRRSAYGAEILAILAKVRHKYLQSLHSRSTMVDKESVPE